MKLKKKYNDLIEKNQKIIKKLNEKFDNIVDQRI